MPKILERLRSQLMAKGMPKPNAYAVATSQLQKHGVLKKGSQELTPKGQTRNSMTAGERAKDRAAKESKGRSTTQYKYNPKTNRATLKK
jgi:hypothetical protein